MASASREAVPAWGAGGALQGHGCISQGVLIACMLTPHSICQLHKGRSRLLRTALQHLPTSARVSVAVLMSLISALLAVQLLAEGRY